jgi:hypothetical protein
MFRQEFQLGTLRSAELERLRLARVPGEASPTMWHLIPLHSHEFLPAASGCRKWISSLKEAAQAYLPFDAEFERRHASSPRTSLGAKSRSAYSLGSLAIFTAIRRVSRTAVGQQPVFIIA